MRIAVIALDGLFDTGLAAVLDTFAFANHLAAEVDRAAPRFEVQTVGLRRHVTTHLGLKLRTDALSRTAGRADIVLVPALFVTDGAQMLQALERSDVREACAALVEGSAAGTTLAAACTGTFLLGETGLLAGRRATTAWWLAPAFRERFPAVRLEDSEMIVDSRELITAGAALAHVDLALWLLRRQSPALAAITARYLAVDARPSQAPFIVLDHLASVDPLLERFEGWARHHLGEPFSIRAAARAVGTSERSLERLTRRVLGRSPVSFVQDLRVALAVHLLRTSGDSVDEIAAQVGYADGVTLRTLLRRRLGRGIRELRRAP